MKKLIILLILFIPTVIHAEDNVKNKAVDFMLKCSSAIDIASNLETDDSIVEKLTNIKKVYFVIAMELSSEGYAKERYQIFYKENMTGGSGPRNPQKWMSFIQNELNLCSTGDELEPSVKSYIQDIIETKMSNNKINRTE